MSDREGRNVMVVIAKATYALPKSHEEPLRLASTQESIVMTDEYVSAPGVSEIRVPTDLVDYKPVGEVIVVCPQHGLGALQGRTVHVEVGPVRFTKKIEKTWPFGPLRRDQDPRRGFAGTYDGVWAAERMPLLPRDFDPRHHLAAPPDQVAQGYFAGDEWIRVANLYEDGRAVSNRLPGLSIAISGNVMHRYFTDVAALDTIMIWSDHRRLTLEWRYALLPKSKIEEVRNVYVDPLLLTTARRLYGRP